MLDCKLHENHLSKPPPATRVMTALKLITTPIKTLMKEKHIKNINTSVSTHTHTCRHMLFNPGAATASNFYWLLVQWWCSHGMMHGVL